MSIIGEHLHNAIYLGIHVLVTSPGSLHLNLESWTKTMSFFTAWLTQMGIL